MNEERMQRFLKMITKHGLRYEPEYSLWLNMKSRCYNSNNKTYNYYGGRGIHICNEWLNNFEQFYKDMCPRPSAKHQIDRIDNDKGYSKDNCQWVSHEANMRNSRTSKYWYVYGIKYNSLSHASSITGLKINTIKRWCDGRCDGGYTYPPKENCWSEKKYA